MISKIFASFKYFFLRLAPIPFLPKANTHPGFLRPLVQQECRGGGEHIWEMETAVGVGGSGLKLFRRTVLLLSLSFLICVLGITLSTSQAMKITAV